MASEYYGLKGNLVKKYQQILNSLGANLKVSGTWGKKTEAAYLAYMDQFNGILTGGASSSSSASEDEETLDNPYQSIAASQRTDGELRAAAENAVGSSYDEQMAQLEKTSQSEQEDVQKQIDSLDATYAGKISQLQALYQQQRQELSDAALKRGLGRSSYVTDQLSGSQKQEAQTYASLGSEKTSQLSTLNDKVAQLRSDYDQSSSRLLSEREKSILSAIDEYRKEDKTAADEAVKYNNSLLQQAREEAESKLEAQKELQNRLAIAMMK